MLLTETIKNSTSAIQNRRIAIENKQQSEIYAKALAQLAQATESIKNSVDCAAAMEEKGIVNTPLMDASTRSDLLACIDDCRNGVSSKRLTLETVKLLKSKGDALAAQIKVIWRDASQKYSDGPKGYLTIIGVLSDDPKQAKDLVDSIAQTVDGTPSTRAVNCLVSNVEKAKQITNEFSLNAEIEGFLKKVSLQRATVLDLTPNILTWLREKNLTSKLKIRF